MTFFSFSVNQMNIKDNMITLQENVVLHNFSNFIYYLNIQLILYKKNSSKIPFIEKIKPTVDRKNSTQKLISNPSFSKLDMMKYIKSIAKQSFQSNNDKWDSLIDKSDIPNNKTFKSMQKIKENDEILN